jgi:riboflavin kinase / FMN adenylyltransferase
MQVHFGAELLRAEWSASVACVGTFDGVHLGHQSVISGAVRLARERELPCVLVTFDRHPASVLHPASCPPAIAALGANLAAFEALGVSVAVVLPFDRQLSLTSALDFFDRLLKDAIHSAAIVIGHDFAFGHERQGTSDWLRERIETVVVPPFQIEGRRVSSSAIRQAVAEGDMAAAGRWLGRPFEVQGVVVAGKRLGRTLGFPTINIARSFEQVTPADGVYAAACTCRLGTFRAAASVGTRPAVGGGPRTIEAYLLDYPGEPLYGEHVRLSLHERLRGEQDFASLDELKAQIALDVEQASGVLSK